MSRTLPTVSVIIPVFDDYGRLTTCLKRLDDQTYPRDLYEIIVVDNGTPDGRIPDLEQSFPDVRWMRELKPGSYAARNAGIDASTSDLLAFTDADCIPSLTWLESGVNAILDHPDAGLVGGPIELFPVDEGNMTAAETWEMIEGFPQKKYIEEFDFTATANAFARREVVDAVGQFDTHFQSGGDREFGERVAAAGYDVLYAPGARIRHPARRSLRALLKKTVRTTRGDYQRMDKNGEWTVTRGTRRLAEALGSLLIPLPRAAIAFATTDADPQTRGKYAATHALVRWTKELELAKLLLRHPVRAGDDRPSGS